MTNWGKIEPTIRMLFPGMTAEAFADALENNMSYLGGVGYYCINGCALCRSCRENDESCYKNILVWLTEESKEH